MDNSMKRNIILGGIFCVFSIVFWIGKSMSFNSKPDVIFDLEDEQVIVNEKLITAQILSESLDRVYKVFENNLAISGKDLVDEESSMNFLDNLTDLLNKFEIKILHLKPTAHKKKGVYTFIPYELIIQCNYEKFGKFITELESSDRLIKIEEFSMKNGIEKLSQAKTPEKLFNQTIEMVISTVTIKKHRG